MEIRDELLEDREAVWQVEAEAFERPDEADLLARLDPDKAFSLVATVDGEIVGHVLFTWLPVGEHRALALAPLAVRPGVQGKGVGGELVRQGLARARALGAPAVVVLGDPAYYGRFGFAPDPKITQSYGWPEEAFQVVKFREIVGEASYPQAFFL
ncbi:GNAT family N-acetyltransferase [Nonomuraea soli]|uniref:Putative acetyltransferase n=1 Tax=Nonomuraea soli TaxID=1032476 RepID=A0A7W0HSJ3_9ACTN|nr:N-acetyltransferase [Nonomuraea soli]MBA2894099.1 putative acetyltransferase [Nonomuraea soli]